MSQTIPMQSKHSCFRDTLNYAYGLTTILVDGNSYTIEGFYDSLERIDDILQYEIRVDTDGPSIFVCLGIKTGNETVTKSNGSHSITREPVHQLEYPQMDEKRTDRFDALWTKLKTVKPSLFMKIRRDFSRRMGSTWTDHSFAKNLTYCIDQAGSYNMDAQEIDSYLECRLWKVEETVLQHDSSYILISLALKTCLENDCIVYRRIDLEEEDTAYLVLETMWSGASQLVYFNLNNGDFGTEGEKLNIHISCSHHPQYIGVFLTLLHRFASSDASEFRTHTNVSVFNVNVYMARVLRDELYGDYTSIVLYNLIQHHQRSVLYEYMLEDANTDSEFYLDDSLGETIHDKDTFSAWMIKHDRKRNLMNYAYGNISKLMRSQTCFCIYYGLVFGKWTKTASAAGEDGSHSYKCPKDTYDIFQNENVHSRRHDIEHVFYYRESCSEISLHELPYSCI